jgi:TPR repeat protein
MNKKILSLCLLILFSIFSSGASLKKGLLAYENGDYQAAYKELRTLAPDGDSDIQFKLAVLYENGQGVTQDYSEAEKWYRLAAEQGNSDAQYRLAKMYDFGQGVRRDYYHAAWWYRLAAEQGNSDAQYYLGVLYEFGQGVPRDYSEAEKLYRLAAAQGNSDAQYRLADQNNTAQGVAEDYAPAVRPYIQAAEQGNIVAQRELGVIYENGIGVSQDKLEAQRWYRLAAAQGDELSSKSLSRLTSQSQNDSTTLAQSGEPAVSSIPETIVVKQNLVLLPIEVVSSEESYEDEYGAAIQSGLSTSFKVYYGADVERELEKEYSKFDCTAEACNQAIAIAFNGELIADASVSKVPGGYLLKLIITNVLTNERIWSRTQPCEGCNVFKVIPALEELGKSVLIH